jgi:beta-glucanase (GH16 family)
MRNQARLSPRRIGALALGCGLGIVGSSAARSAPAGSHPASASVRPARHLIWSDDFDGRAGARPSPRWWRAVTGGDGWGNQELEYYTDRASNVALDGHGHLVITARHQIYRDASGLVRDYTSARIQTEGLFETRYGELEARIQLPAGRGLWPAFWALGANIGSVGWPACGEIDVVENVGSDPFAFHGSIHGPEPGQPHGYALNVGKRSPVSLARGFHVYGVDWSPGQLVFTLDGRAFGKLTPASLSRGEQWVFDQPFYLLLDLAVGGTGPGSPGPGTRFPARMVVDWVRVYS